MEPHPVRGRKHRRRGRTPPDIWRQISQRDRDRNGRQAGSRRRPVWQPHRIARAAPQVAFSSLQISSESQFLDRTVRKCHRTRRAVFLCADIVPELEPRPAHASYIASRLSVLKNEKRFLFLRPRMRQGQWPISTIFSLWRNNVRLGRALLMPVIAASVSKPRSSATMPELCCESWAAAPEPLVRIDALHNARSDYERHHRVGISL